MNSPRHSLRARPEVLRRSLAFSLALAFASLLASPPYSLRAQLYQSDNFNDGNDNGWTRYDPFGSLGANLVQWSFPNGGYRIRTLAPSPNPALAGPGRGGSLRSEIYTDFYIAVDVVNWNDALPQAVGILARVSNAGLGSTLGYAFTWSRGNPASDTAGSVDVSVITDEAPSGVDFIGNDQIHLEPGKAYRFVFIGRGPTLEGRIYELPDTTNPKIDVIGTDATYASGASGLVIYDNSSGGGTNICDATFDNFYVTDIEPPRIQMTDVFFGYYELSWPAEASQFVLESSTVLPGTATDWTLVDPALVTLDGDHYRYTMAASADPAVGGLPKQFFRLARRTQGSN